MQIYLNDVLTTIPNDYMTVEELIKWKELPVQGTAIAIDGKVIRRTAWTATTFTPLCHVNVISAAFGG